MGQPSYPSTFLGLSLVVLPSIMPKQLVFRIVILHPAYVAEKFCFLFIILCTMLMLFLMLILLLNLYS